MHQVLSYETTVRANNATDFREYLTRRHFFTVILIIAFIAFISGYLIGNFIPEHNQQHINSTFIKKDNPNSIELSSNDYASLKEIHAYYKIKEKLLATAQTLSKMLKNDESYVASSLNTEIFNKYISCTQDIPPNTNIESSQFIEQLIDNTAARQRDCLRIIQFVIDNHLAKS